MMALLRRPVAPAWLTLSALAVSVSAQEPPGDPSTRLVQVGGHTIRAQISGLTDRRRSEPVIVFEAGATQSLETWRRVLPHLSGVAPFVTYDRAGLGESTWDELPPTPRHVSTRLRELLRAVGADPPYVLVGYSWGGSLMRYFAGYYPEEVAGIVYVDPGPVVTQSFEDELVPFDLIGAGRAGYEAFWSAYEQALARASPAARAEFDVYRRLMLQDTAQRDIRPQPNVPVVVILAAKPYLPIPGLPYDVSRHFQVDLRHRIQKLQEWALSSGQGTVVVTNHASHAVPREDPELIAWSVKRVLDAIGK